MRCFWDNHVNPVNQQAVRGGVVGVAQIPTADAHVFPSSSHTNPITVGAGQYGTYGSTGYRNAYQLAGPEVGANFFPLAPTFGGFPLFGTPQFAATPAGAHQLLVARFAVNQVGVQQFPVAQLGSSQLQ
jgi:hypothetical protein